MNKSSQICQAIHLISAYNKEIKSLIDQIKIQLENAIHKKGELPCKITDERAKFSEQYDESDSIRIGISTHIALAGRKEKTAERYLSIQISTYGDAIGQPFNDEPLVHVHLWAAPVNFRNSDYLGWPTSTYPKRVESNLILWDGDESNVFSSWTWTYSLKLLNINCDDDIDKHIVRPVIDLLMSSANLPDHNVNFDQNVVFQYSDSKIREMQQSDEHLP